MASALALFLSVTRDRRSCGPPSRAKATAHNSPNHPVALSKVHTTEPRPRATRTPCTRPQIICFFPLPLLAFWTFNFPENSRGSALSIKIIIIHMADTIPRTLIRLKMMLWTNPTIRSRGRCSGWDAGVSHRQARKPFFYPTSEKSLNILIPVASQKKKKPPEMRPTRGWLEQNGDLGARVPKVVEAVAGWGARPRPVQAERGVRGPRGAWSPSSRAPLSELQGAGPKSQPALRLHKRRNLHNAHPNGSRRDGSQHVLRGRPGPRRRRQWGRGPRKE